MKLTRYEVVGIVRVLEKIVELGKSKSLIFKYLSKKIRETLKSESEAIKEVKPVKLMDYEAKIAEAYKEYAVKEGNEFKFVAGASANPTIYDLEIKDRVALGNKIAEINSSTNMVEIQEEDKEIDRFMREEIDYDLPKLKLKDMPDDLSDADVEVLFKILEE